MIGILKSFNCCYLATPYSKYEGGLDLAFTDACKLAGKMFEFGIKVYCPIAHGHPISLHGGIPAGDYSIWHPHNFALARMTDALIVGTLKGWDSSKGVQDEVEFFKLDQKPIYYVDPKSMAFFQVAQ